jgi:transcriptional regulator with XRE-family HTH domain
MESATAEGAVAGRGWTVDGSTFGARLALIRQRMDWNLKEAADECNVPAASWTNWERKGADPRGLLNIVRQISDRTGCDYLWLLAGPEGGAQ